MNSEILEASFDEEEFNELIETLKNGDRDKVPFAVIRLIALGTKVVTPLIELLRNRNYAPISLDVAYIVGHIGTPALEKLLKALKDRNSFMRAGAATALGLLPITHIEVSPALIGALNDKASRVRTNAARSLGRHENKEALEPLIKALSDPNFDVRCAAAFSLGEIPDERAITALLILLKCEEEDPEVQLATVEALGRLGDKQALEQIKRIEEHGRYEWLREGATQAIAAINSQ